MPTGIPIHRAGISKKLAPGQPGTKRYQRQFGDALVCVRYLIHPETARRYTTVEIVVDEKRLPAFPAPNDTAEETLVALAIAYGETDLRQRVKQAGGKWDQDRKVWLLPYGIACKLGLHGRIRKGGDGHA
ncbi:MAG: hypothetical protein PHS77_06335 [Gallionellaceae bacterium]|nr:hypothetical protein [Gallionellaceae bacterium]